MEKLEVLKEILMCDDVETSLKNNKETIFAIIPLLKDEDGFEQKNPWHCYDVWNHTIKTISSCPKDFKTRLIMLLHDIGKPHSYQEDELGRHFHNHANKSKELSKPILEELGYKDHELNEILSLIGAHATTINISEVNNTNLAFYNKLIILQLADGSSYEPHHSKDILSKLSLTKTILDRKTLVYILESEDIVSSINDNIDFITSIIPEIRPMIGFEHKHPHHHLDVWQHTLLALSTSKQDYKIRLVLLLHDIGKPICFTEGEVRHFHNHPEYSSNISKVILNRLKFEEDFISEVCSLICHHDTPISESDAKLNPVFYRELYEVQYCDALAHHPNHLGKRLEYLEKIRKILDPEGKILKK